MEEKLALEHQVECVQAVVPTGAVPPTLRAALPQDGKRLLGPGADVVDLVDDDKDEVASVAPSDAPSAVLVPNPCPLKRIPPNVLREEDYREAVSDIIERDFFPDLSQLRLKAQLLQAINGGEEDEVRSLEWKLAHLRRPTPANTPAATPSAALQPSDVLELPGRSSGARGSTSAATPGPLSAWELPDDVSECTAFEDAIAPHRRLNTIGGKELNVDLSNVRLDDFQRLFTSEDNASFEKILEHDKERVRARQWWIEAMEKKHNTEHKAHVKALEHNGSVEPGAAMHNEFKARNALSFHQESLIQVGIQKPRVDVKNTRFTTKQQQELDQMLGASFQAREARLKCERLDNAYEKMAQDGRFKHLSTFISSMKVKELREVGGRLESPFREPGAPDRHGYSFVDTPELLPGQGNLSPLMTFGKLGSTPKLLAEEAGPNFRMNETSAREEAADKLQRTAMQKQRDTQAAKKADRLRSLGITPKGTPRSTKSTPASGPATPGSVASTRVASMSPIGQLIHKARKLAQKGGQLQIGSARSPAATPRSIEPPRKRSRRSGEDGGARGSKPGTSLPASITDDLL